jgi:hypothetical protein
MSAHVWLERFRPYSVPLCVFAIVVVAVLFVPPLLLGEATARTYALTAAVLILAITSVFPYAVVVSIVTLPLLYIGIGSYAAPRVIPVETLSTGAILRHVVAGVSYVLAAAIVGAIGLGADFATSSGSSPLPSALRPSFLLVGGVAVAGTFVGLQLWRYDTPVRTLDRRAILGTAVLGGLLALSPVVSLWMFGTAMG